MKQETIRVVLRILKYENVLIKRMLGYTSYPDNNLSFI